MRPFAVNPWKIVMINRAAPVTAAALLILMVRDVNGSDLALSQFQQGLSALRENNYNQAIKAFRSVIDAAGERRDPQSFALVTEALHLRATLTTTCINTTWPWRI